MLRTGRSNRAVAARVYPVMRGWLFVVIGALLVLLGAVWTLQGLDVLGGSAMSGVTLWAIVGPIVAVVGVVLLAMGVRRLRAAS
jgi:hypothetical protein